MSEARLEEYFRRIDFESEVTLNPILKDLLEDFIFENPKIKDPYKFAHDTNLDVENTLKIFLYFVDGNNPPLLLQPYLDCQNMECKSPIYLDESNEDDVLSCLNCFDEYPKEELKHLVKIRFIKNDNFFISNKTPSSTYDVLKSSDRGLKSLPAISQKQNPFANSDKIAGSSLGVLTKINNSAEGNVISKKLTSIDEQFSKAMGAFQLK